MHFRLHKHVFHMHFMHYMLDCATDDRENPCKLKYATMQKKKCCTSTSVSPVHLYEKICKNMQEYARYVSMKFMICKQ